MIKILIIEDDTKISKMLQTLLNNKIKKNTIENRIYFSINPIFLNFSKGYVSQLRDK